MGIVFSPLKMPDSRLESRLALTTPPPYHPPPFNESKSFLMLQWMHRLSTSWVASIFMGVLALSFVVWGIADVFTGMTSTALATVGSTEISVDLNSQLPTPHSCSIRRTAGGRGGE